MNGAALISAVRTAILAGHTGATGVYVAGSVKDKPKLPFVVLSIVPSQNAPATTDADIGTDGVQVDALAGTLADAIVLSDLIDSIVLGLGAVAVASSPTSFGIRRASGSWRTVFPSEPATTGERVERVASLYTQTEIRPK